MKAITIRQPQASLIAKGHKSYETRSWPTKHRGLIVIHAAKKIPSFVIDPVIRYAVSKIGRLEHLPLGAIIAMADLVDVIPTNKLLQDPEFYKKDEILFGNYQPDRFAWKLENVRRVKYPIQASGKQGFWNWECPFVLADILDCSTGSCIGY